MVPVDFMHTYCMTSGVSGDSTLVGSITRNQEQVCPVFTCIYLAGTNRPAVFTQLFCAPSLLLGLSLCLTMNTK